MVRQRVEMVVEMLMKIFIILIIFLSGFGTAVLYLWNWLIPNLFGLHAITYWQAIGLLCLCWLLFGGFGWLGGGSRRHRSSSSTMTDRLAQITPEERAKFREGLSGRC